MRKPKIVVVGAGPAGASFALALSKLNFGEVLLLDKSRYPRVKVCGSGLSPLALKMLDTLELKERFKDNHAPLAALEAKGPGGTIIRLQAGEGAWVVPRVELDHTLAQAAEQHGTTFQPETKATALLRDREGKVCGVKTSQGELEADLVVCADGAPSRFSQDSSPKRGIRTLMGWWTDTDLPRDTAVMVWDERLEGYYAWAFPEPGGVVNIGITIPEEAPHASRLKELFESILDQHFRDRMQRAEQRGKWMGHPAVVATRIGPMAESKALWAGEAARLVMPGTVEGIGFAMQNGIDAATFSARHFEWGSGFSKLAAEGYRMRASAKVLPKFWAGQAFVRLMDSPLARQAFSRIMNERVRKVVENGAAMLVGEDIGAAPKSGRTVGRRRGRIFNRFGGRGARRPSTMA